MHPRNHWTQRAQRSTKFNLARNFQSRSRFLISLKNFNLDVSIPHKKQGRGGWLARKLHSCSKSSISLEISKFFDLWALWEISLRDIFNYPLLSKSLLRGEAKVSLEGCLHGCFFSRIWRDWPKFLAGCPQGRPAETSSLGWTFASEQQAIHGHCLNVQV